MSLTSQELNYLIWRYFQEAGHDVVAYAIDKHTHALQYEHPGNDAVAKIGPGCLVDLVQKGILYLVAHNVDVNNNTASLFGALVEDDLDDELPQIKKEPSPKLPVKSLSPDTTYPPSLVTAWHPHAQVYAYGREDSSAVVVDGDSSVTLQHPVLVNELAAGANQINLVLWAPSGDVLVTSGTNGELRAWLADGKLKNIAATGDAGPVVVDQVLWSEGGRYLLLIDSNNHAYLWDGSNLNLLHRIKVLSAEPHHGAWLGTSKYAVSSRHEIHIFQELAPMALLTHDSPVSHIAFNTSSKLLAALLETSVRVWNQSLAAHHRELPVAEMVHGLYWQSELRLLVLTVEGTLSVWDVNTTASTHRVAEGVVFAGALSPSAQYLAVAEDSGSVSVWDVTSAPTKTASFTNQGNVCGVSWDASTTSLAISYSGTESVIVRL